MYRRFKYRIYPNKQQEALIQKHFDGVRFVYNLALETKNYAYSKNKTNISRFELCRQFTEVRAISPWLKELNSHSLRAAITNLDSAFNYFYRGVSKYPRYKKKKSNQSYQCPCDVKVDIDSGVIKLPKIKAPIKVKYHRKFDGKTKTVTVSRSSSGKYFITVLVESNRDTAMQRPVEKQSAVGIDMGLKNFAILSSGSVINAPKPLKNSIQRVRILSRRLSKKKKGSSNFKKSAKNLAVLYEKISNKRTDFLHKLSHQIANGFDTVCMEKLSVMGLIRSRNIARSIIDAGWYEFRGFVKYKIEEKGGTLIEIDRFAPSSKVHSICGYKNSLLSLDERTWVCPFCGELVNRDMNAAQNILDFGFLKYSGGVSPEEPVELPIVFGAKKQERWL